MSSQNNLALGMHCQLADFWCWAAVAQTVNAFAGRSTAQHEIATRHTGVSCSEWDIPDTRTACGPRCVGGCNSPHRLSQVLIDEGHSVHAQPLKVLAFEQVVATIDSGRPLPIRIAFTSSYSGGGHFVCITGYTDGGDGNRFVTILDPLVPGLRRGAAAARDIPFDMLASGRYRVNGAAGIPNYAYELS